MKQFDIVELIEDINPKLKKGMRGTILEIYGNGKAYEIEFMDKNKKTIEFEGNLTFTISKDKLKIIKSI